MEVQERTVEEGGSLVSLTPAAAVKIRALMAEDADVSVLRVAIEGGGCSGFQYGLGFDRGAQEGDHAFECEGVTVVVDPFSAPYLLGAQVDYLETIQESGFKIENPNAVSSCGCGHSFQVAEGEAPEDAAGGCGYGCAHCRCWGHTPWLLKRASSRSAVKVSSARSFSLDFGHFS